MSAITLLIWQSDRALKLEFHILLLGIPGEVGDAGAPGIFFASLISIGSFAGEKGFPGIGVDKVGPPGQIGNFCNATSFCDSTR